MFYNKEFNQYVVEGTSFELGGIKYPSNWLNQASEKEKSDAGLVEVVATNSPADDRFYWVSQELKAATLTYVNTPKDLDALKKQWSDSVNNQVYAQLQPSDYLPARAFETGEPMSEVWKAYRAAVRTLASQTKVAIAATTTVDELASIVTSIAWPNDPNYVAPAQQEAIVE